MILLYFTVRRGPTSISTWLEGVWNWTEEGNGGNHRGHSPRCQRPSFVPRKWCNSGSGIPCGRFFILTWNLFEHMFCTHVAPLYIEFSMLDGSSVSGFSFLPRDLYLLSNTFKNLGFHPYLGITVLWSLIGHRHFGVFLMFSWLSCRNLWRLLVKLLRNLEALSGGGMSYCQRFCKNMSCDCNLVNTCIVHAYNLSGMATCRACKVL